MNSIIMAVMPVVAVLAIAIAALFRMDDPNNLKEILILAITSIGSMTTGGVVGYSVGRGKTPTDKPVKKY